VDFRKGIDALVAVCQQQLIQNPFSGCVFAFRNRTKNAVKLLIYDGTGFWLCLKRFSQGRLKWWPTSTQTLQSITPTALQILLSQGDPSIVRLAKDWHSITPSLD
jgi:transposase